MRRSNMNLYIDFYEFTMAQVLFDNGQHEEVGYFDYFFRKVPDSGGFAIMAGLEQQIEFILNQRFSEDDINYLREQGMSEAFLTYLKNYKFRGSIWGIPEGTPVFPNEPLVTVKATMFEHFMIETSGILEVSHQTLIATKANRIVRAANGKPVIDFGPRRSQGKYGGLKGARAAYVAGVVGTSLTEAGKEYGIPVVGTMAHSFVTYVGEDKEAFDLYVKTHDAKAVFLVDTFSTLKLGMPAAIEVMKTMKPSASMGIRLDSGSLLYLSNECRKMMDDAGLPNATITVSNSLDEWKVTELEMKNAPIDFYGVGERMITAKSDSVFGGVYKLVGVERDGEVEARIKISDSPGKTVNPAFKEVWRLYDNETGQAFADVLTLKDETIKEPYLLTDELEKRKNKVATNFKAVKLQQEIVKEGVLVYDFPTLEAIRERLNEQLKTLWTGLMNFSEPDRYYVNLSDQLYDLKDNMIEGIRSRIIKG